MLYSILAGMFFSGSKVRPMRRLVSTKTGSTQQRLYCSNVLYALAGMRALNDRYHLNLEFLSGSSIVLYKEFVDQKNINDVMLVAGWLLNGNSAKALNLKGLSGFWQSRCENIHEDCELSPKRRRD